MGFEKDIREIFQEILNQHGGNKAAAAESLGVNSVTFWGWLEGKRVPNMKALAPAMEKIGARIVFPSKETTGGHPTMRRMGVHSPAQQVLGDDLQQVPVMACAGAGPAVEDCNLELVQTISVLKEYMQPSLFACKIVGDSMEPAIADGAYVGVTPLSENLVEGAIYLVWQPPFGLVAKRVYPGQDGTLILRSDNPKVKDIIVDATAYENIIKGRVVWVWQNV